MLFFSVAMLSRSFSDKSSLTNGHKKEGKKNKYSSCGSMGLKRTIKSPLVKMEKPNGRYEGEKKKLESEVWDANESNRLRFKELESQGKFKSGRWVSIIDRQVFRESDSREDILEAYYNECKQGTPIYIVKVGEEDQHSEMDFIDYSVKRGSTDSFWIDVTVTSKGGSHSITEPFRVATGSDISTLTESDIHSLELISPVCIECRGLFSGARPCKAYVVEFSLDGLTTMTVLCIEAPVRLLGMNALRHFNIHIAGEHSMHTCRKSHTPETHQEYEAHFESKPTADELWKLEEGVRTRREKFYSELIEDLLEFNSNLTEETKKAIRSSIMNLDNKIGHTSDQEMQEFEDRFY